MNVIYLALCYIFAIGIFGGIYFILGKTKCKHQAALDRVRELRKKIQDSKRKQRKIKQQIRKDKDESSYGLEEYDTEIENLQRSISELLEQKKIALSDFDNATSRNIKDQIVLSHEDELDALKAEYHKVYDQNKENLDRLNKLSLSISAEYEGYLGKDFMSLEKIEQLEEIMTAGSANTIAEAVAAMTKKQ
jgi:seryl-tRNA synthetase